MLEVEQRLNYNNIMIDVFVDSGQFETVNAVADLGQLINVNCTFRFLLAGMNFYDFFIFLARICFANLVQACYQLRDKESLVHGLSPTIRHLTLNLKSIRKVALKMKSMDGLTRNRGLHLDFRETLDNPEFLKLCVAWEKTYGVIYNQQKCDHHSKKSLMCDIKDLDFIRTLSSQVSTPEDLVMFIDHVIKKLAVFDN